MALRALCFASALILLTLPTALCTFPSSSDICSICRCSHDAIGLVIDCKGLGLTQVPPVPLNTTVLDLSHNSLSVSALPENVFEGLTQLYALDIAENPIGVWPTALALADLPALEILDLTDCSLHALPAGALEKTPNLTMLFLANNLLTASSIYSGAFEPLHALRSLLLDSNRFQTLPLALQHGSFSELTVLSINNVGLGHLQAHAFANMPRLENLGLKGNRLTNNSISPFAFAGLFALRLLTLDFNPLSSFPMALATSPMPNVTSLSLGNTLISSLEGGHIFRQVPNLAALDLSGNQLAAINIEWTTFNTTRHLKSLFLHNNPLGTYPFALIVGTLPCLNELTLRSTKLSAVPAEAFLQFASNITLLDLSYNYLTADSLAPHAFSATHSLNQITLSSNALGHYPAALQSQALASVQWLRLDECVIRVLPDDAFATMPQLLYLSLQRNQLGRLPSTLFDFSPHLVTLDLSQNPLGCDWPPALLSTALANVKTLFLSGVGLTSVPRNAFVNMPDVGLHALDLSNNTLTASSIDPDVFRSTHLVTTLTLDNNPLGAIPDALFLLPVGVSTLSMNNVKLAVVPSNSFANDSVIDYLCLSNNLLTADSIAPTAFSSLERLSTLDLSGNPLGRWPDALLLGPAPRYGDHLATLNLASTNISSIPENAFAGLRALTQLFLNDNPALASLPANLFDETRLLNSVSLDRTFFPDFPAALSHIPSLTTLSMVDCSLSYVPQAAFENTALIKYINFASNSITAVDFLTDAFAIETLILDFNPLDPLRLSSLRLVIQLEVLSLVHCNLDISLASVAFTSLQNSLSELYLDGNNAPYYPDLFKTFSALRILSMRDTGLPALPDDAFYNLQSLSGVFLSGNQLHSIPDMLFSEALSLEQINLDSNHLLAYPTRALAQLRTVSSISLANNNISAISVGSFDATLALRHLNLSNNAIEAIPCALFDTLHLDTLSLVDNSLRNASACWLDALSKVESFSLSGNSLVNVDHAFSRWHNLRLLALTSNRLRTVPAGLPVSLEMLFLDDNDIDTLDPSAIVPIGNLTYIGLAENRLSTHQVQRLLSYYTNAQLRLLTINVIANELTGSFMVPPINAIDLSSNGLTSVVTDSLPFTREWGLLSVLNQTGFTGPACPPNVVGAWPVCDGICSAYCTPHGMGGCSSPSPRSCCPLGYHGPNCAYAFHCQPGLCGPHGTCEEHNLIPLSKDGLAFTYNLTCTCTDGFYSLQPTSAAALKVTNVPSCVSVCPSDTYISANNACESCSSTCGTGGCKGPSSKDCIENHTARTATAASSSSVIIVLLVALLVWRLGVRKRRRDVAQTKGLYERLLEDVNQVWQVSEQDVRFERRIASGASGEVWFGEWLGRSVAVKKLRMEVAETDDELLRDFNKEVAFLKGMRHRNIVLFYGAGRLESTNCPFLVLEHMERGSLDKLLHASDEKVTWDLRVSIANDVARGMRFLHKRDPPVLHRDLKSLNVLLNDRWIAKIADFGESRAIEALQGTRKRGRRARAMDAMQSAVSAATNGKGGGGLHGSGGSSSGGGSGSGKEVSPGGSAHSSARGITSRRGTPGWCAPEAQTGEQYGLSADVFSFAIVMWEIAARSFPFEDLPTWAVGDAVAEGQRPSVPTDTPLLYAELMERCWDHDPTRRPTFDMCCDLLDDVLL